MNYKENIKTYINSLESHFDQALMNLCGEFSPITLSHQSCQDSISLDNLLELYVNYYLKRCYIDEESPCGMEQYPSNIYGYPNFFELVNTNKDIEIEKGSYISICYYEDIPFLNNVLSKGLFECLIDEIVQKFNMRSIATAHKMSVCQSPCLRIETTFTRIFDKDDFYKWLKKVEAKNRYVVYDTQMELYDTIKFAGNDEALAELPIYVNVELNVIDSFTATEEWKSINRKAYISIDSDKNIHMIFSKNSLFEEYFKEIIEVIKTWHYSMVGNYYVLPNSFREKAQLLLDNNFEFQKMKITKIINSKDSLIFARSIDEQKWDGTIGSVVMCHVSQRELQANELRLGFDNILVGISNL